MSTTTDQITLTAPPPQASRRQPPPHTVAPPRKTRRPAFIALGFALAAVCGLGAAWAVTAASSTQVAIALARPVPEGALISRADLTTAKVRPDPALHPLSARHIPEIVGQRATTALSAGSLLTPEQFSDTLLPAKGKTLVGLAVKPAQIPSEGLAPGDPIRIIAVPGDATPNSDIRVGTGTGTGSDLFDDTLPVINATVASVGAGDNGDGQGSVTMVNVIVAPTEAVGLAARAATGRIAIVVDSRAH